MIYDYMVVFWLLYALSVLFTYWYVIPALALLIGIACVIRSKVNILLTELELQRRLREWKMRDMRYDG